MTTAIEQRINRIEKLLVERRGASSFSEAGARLDSFNVGIAVEPRRAADLCSQVALGTFVILATRFARGGVHVAGVESAPNGLPGVAGDTLADALVGLGARLCPPGSLADAEVLLGKGAARGPESHAIRVDYGQWWASTGPLSAPAGPGGDNPLAAVAAGALGASEAFCRLLDPQRALFKLQYLSLLPNLGLGSADQGPALQFLPSHLWILGLGHIGQALAWCLSMLPYQDPADVTLVLQDTDRAGESTPSTSVLTGVHDIGRLKTRITSSLLERRGFETRLVERAFDVDTRCQPRDPRAILVAVDNVATRRWVATAGFDVVVDAGIGARAANFDSLTVRTLPGTLDLERLWIAAPGLVDDLLALDAYQNLARSGVDSCGLTQVAAKAVGAPFVGMAAACLAIAQLLGLLHSRGADEVVSTRLRSLEDTERATNSVLGTSMNFGLVEIAIP